MSTRTMAIAVAAAVQAACTTDDPARSNLNGQRHEQVVETRGDTTVVRTLSGSVWGAEANLVAEFAIGELDGPDEYLFGSIGSFAVDDAMSTCWTHRLSMSRSLTRSAPT
ncbi:MAG: hypothetical protein OXI76_14110 [Gemmatimonadota bacterium]|nr:hypothetical protein [Gemmatimonadota bacterium]